MTAALIDIADHQIELTNFPVLETDEPPEKRQALQARAAQRATAQAPAHVAPAAPAVVRPGVQVYPGMPLGGGGGHYQPQDEGPQVLYNQQGNAAKKDPSPKKGGMYELKFGENGKVERHRVFDNGANNLGQRPQGHVRENHELIQDACNKAQRVIDEGGPAVAGIKRHKIAENLVKGYQRIFGPRGIEVEVWYKNGVKLDRPAPGAVRIDALDYENKIIYDYKFVKNPGRGMGPKQAKNYLEHMPADVRDQFRVIEVNPIK